MTGGERRLDGPIAGRPGETLTLLGSYRFGK